VGSSRLASSTLALLLAQAVAGSGCGSAPPRSPTPPPSASASAPPGPPEPPAAPEPAETPDAEFRKRPPRGGSEGGFSVPIPAETRLDNGVRVLFLESHAAPVVSIQVLIARGAEQAPPGVGGFAGAMLLMGTKTRSSTQLSDAFEALGATYGGGVDLDTTGVQATVLSGDAPTALALLADIVQNAEYPEDEVERVRQRRLTALAEESDDPRAVLWNAVHETLYPVGHPYHASLLGGEEAIRKIKRADLLRFHRAHVQPDATTVVVAGDITREGLFEAVGRAFGGWRGRAAAAVAPRAPPASSRKQMRIVLIDRPGATQTHVAVAAPGAPRASKDHDALMVLATLLSRRINGNLRERRGLTYGVSAAFSFRRGAGPFVAGGPVVREQTAAAVREIFVEIDRVRGALVSPNELIDVRSILGALSARFETAQSSAASLSPLAIYGLSTDEYMTRRVRLQMVDRPGLQRAAQGYLKQGRLSVVMVGDARAIEADIRGLGLGEVEVRRPKAAQRLPGAPVPGASPSGPGGEVPPVVPPGQPPGSPAPPHLPVDMTDGL
jgi:zinc protease